MPGKKRIAIVGSGPAGLMAATQLLQSPNASQFEIHIFEKRPGLGRKLLIAGSSGLNISHDLSPAGFAGHYEGWNPDFWKQLFEKFGKSEWIRFIEADLHLETFLGTSHRYFVREMKASGMLKSWMQHLTDRGVILRPGLELIDFQDEGSRVQLSFFKTSTGETEVYPCDRAVFALGGGSWEDEEPKWASVFQKKSLRMIPFEASNVGFEVNWDPKFLLESEGKPLKKVSLETSRGTKLGEMVVTRYGLEGTPVYFCGTPGIAYLDLKPDLSEAEIFEKLNQVKENLSPMRRVKRLLSLSEASENLVFHHTDAETKADLKKLIRALKHLPLELVKPRPLSEAISSRGGLSLDEVNEDFALKKFPNLYCGGEMLAWDAPTGGFLIQAAISQGAHIGRKLWLT